jgi:hypothetical protein
MDHYDFPLHDSPKGMESNINAFYQAKFGMFTCHDTLARIGGVRYAEDLIEYWVKSKTEQIYTWHLSIAHSISKSSTKFDWDSIKNFKKNFR